MDEIVLLLETNYDNKLTVLAITEHWLNPGEEQFIQIPGYQMASCFTRKDSIHGGSCIFVHKNVEFVEIEQLKQKSKEIILECSAVELKWQKTIIINIYRSPSGDIKEFFSILDDILKEGSKYKTHTIVVSGDFNIDFGNKNSKELINFLDIVTSYDLKITIHDPTRITNTSKKTLDNILTNNEKYLSRVVISSLSDHLAQEITIDTNTSQNFSRTYEIRNFSDKNLAQIEAKLQEVSWKEKLTNKDSNNCHSILEEIISKIINEVSPKTICKQTTKCKKWLTVELKNKCKIKRQLYEGMIKGEVSKKTYEDFRDQLKKDIQYQKRKCNSEFLLASDNKIRDTWKLINNVTDRKSQKIKFNIANFKTEDESYEEKLNNINKQLIDMVEDININTQVNKSLITSTINTFVLLPTDAEEVYNTIQALKNTHTVGYDEIPTKLLKYCAHSLAEPLSILINKCFQEGTFPDKLKITMLTLLHKKGDVSELNNYRPIALLSVIAKVMEKIIANRIYDFLIKFKILNDNQNGYIKNRSTTRAVFQMLEDIITGINENEYTVCLYVDLTKAFDSVHHQTLLEKLEALGFRGPTLKLFKSYLSNRQQYLVTEDDHTGKRLISNGYTIKRGVPQGSVLGPILYLLYVNELPKLLNHITTSFADDTSIVIRSTGVTVDKIISVLESLNEWYQQNNLKLNISKTNIMEFKNKQNIAIEFKNEKLNPTNDTMFLGVNIDSELNWKEHIYYISSKLSSFNYALKILATTVNRAASLSAYYAYVQSRLKYGIIFWGNSVEAERLFKIQKACIRSMFQLDYNATCKNTFKNEKILTVPSIYIYECACFVKLNYELFSNKELIHTYDTRGTVNPYLNPAQTTRTKVQKSAPYQLIRIYNALPNQVKQMPIKDYKKCLKDFLCNNVFYKIEDFFKTDFN